MDFERWLSSKIQSGMGGGPSPVPTLPAMQPSPSGVPTLFGRPVTDYPPQAVAELIKRVSASGNAPSEPQVNLAPPPSAPQPMNFPQLIANAGGQAADYNADFNKDWLTSHPPAPVDPTSDPVYQILVKEGNYKPEEIVAAMGQLDPSITDFGAKYWTVSQQIDQNRLLTTSVAATAEPEDLSGVAARLGSAAISPIVHPKGTFEALKTAFGPVQDALGYAQHQNDLQLATSVYHTSKAQISADEHHHIGFGDLLHPGELAGDLKANTVGAIKNAPYIAREAIGEPLAGFSDATGMGESMSMTLWASKNPQDVVTAMENGFVRKDKDGNIIQQIPPGQEAVIAAYYDSLGGGFTGGVESFGHQMATDPLNVIPAIGPASKALEGVKVAEEAGPIVRALTDALTMGEHTGEVTNPFARAINAGAHAAGKGLELADTAIKAPEKAIAGTVKGGLGMIGEGVRHVPGIGEPTIRFLTETAPSAVRATTRDLTNQALRTVAGSDLVAQNFRDAAANKLGITLAKEPFAGTTLGATEDAANAATGDAGAAGNAAGSAALDVIDQVGDFNIVKAAEDSYVVVDKSGNIVGTQSFTTPDAAREAAQKLSDATTAAGTTPANGGQTLTYDLSPASNTPDEVPPGFVVGPKGEIYQPGSIYDPAHPQYKPETYAKPESAPPPDVATPPSDQPVAPPTQFNAEHVDPSLPRFMQPKEGGTRAVDIAATASDNKAFFDEYNKIAADTYGSQQKFVAAGRALGGEDRLLNRAQMAISEHLGVAKSNQLLRDTLDMEPQDPFKHYHQAGQIEGKSSAADWWNKMAEGQKPPTGPVLTKADYDARLANNSEGFMHVVEVGLSPNKEAADHVIQGFRQVGSKNADAIANMIERARGEMYPAEAAGVALPTSPVADVAQEAPLRTPRVEPTTTQPLPTASQVFDGTIPSDARLPDRVQAAWDANEDILANRMRTEREIPVQDVPLNAKIIATQSDLVPEKLQAYIDNPNLSSETSDLPVAIKDGDTYYVVEGNHRTAAARVRGEASTPMRVIDTGHVDVPVEGAPATPNASTNAVEQRQIDAGNYQGPLTDTQAPKTARTPNPKNGVEEFTINGVEPDNYASTLDGEMIVAGIDQDGNTIVKGADNRVRYLDGRDVKSADGSALQLRPVDQVREFNPEQTEAMGLTPLDNAPAAPPPSSQQAPWESDIPLPEPSPKVAPTNGLVDASADDMYAKLGETHPDLAAKADRILAERDTATKAIDSRLNATSDVGEYADLATKRQAAIADAHNRIANDYTSATGEAAPRAPYEHPEPNYPLPDGKWDSTAQRKAAQWFNGFKTGDTPITELDALIERALGPSDAEASRARSVLKQAGAALDENGHIAADASGLAQTLRDARGKIYGPNSVGDAGKQLGHISDFQHELRRGKTVQEFSAPNSATKTRVGVKVTFTDGSTRDLEFGSLKKANDFIAENRPGAVPVEKAAPTLRKPSTQVDSAPVASPPETPIPPPEGALSRDAAFSELADAQRGSPEQAMLKFQAATGNGGVLTFTSEHVGDLTNRMAAYPGRGGFGYENVVNKVEKTLSTLESKYGFEREMRENFKANKVNEADARAAGQAYADAHRALPVYNEAQQHARDAAVAVGEFRFNDAITELKALKSHLGSESEWSAYAGKFDPNFEGKPPIPPPETPPPEGAPLELNVQRVADASQKVAPPFIRPGEEARPIADAPAPVREKEPVNWKRQPVPGEARATQRDPYVGIWDEAKRAPNVEDGVKKFEAYAEKRSGISSEDVHQSKELVNGKTVTRLAGSDAQNKIWAEADRNIKNFREGWTRYRGGADNPWPAGRPPLEGFSPAPKPTPDAFPPGGSTPFDTTTVGGDRGAVLHLEDQITPAGDLDPLAELLRTGAIDEKGHELLSQHVKVGGDWTQTKGPKTGVAKWVQGGERAYEGGDTSRVFDVFMRHVNSGMSEEEAIAETLKTLGRDVPMKYRGYIGKALVGTYKGLNQLVREHKMFGPKGLVGILTDMIGDIWTQGTSEATGAIGESLDLGRGWRIFRGGRKAADGITEILASTDTGRSFDKLGVVGRDIGHYGPEEVSRSGEMLAHRMAERIFRVAMSEENAHKLARSMGIIASENFRDLRVGMDINRRWSLIGMELKKLLPKTRGDFFDLVRERAAVNPDLTPDADRLIKGLGDEFSPADVLRLSKEAGFSDGQAEHLARSWRSSVSDLERQTFAEQNRVAFDFTPTRLDEALKNVFMFHSWQTRAAPLYLRNALRNPALLSAYAKVAHDLKRACEESGSHKCGYLELATTGAGMVASINPMYSFSSALINLEPKRWHNPDATIIDNMLSLMPASVAPAFQGLITGIGMSNVEAPDILGFGTDTRSIESILDYGKSHGWFGDKETLANIHYGDFLVKAQKAAYDWVGQYNPMSSPPKGLDPHRSENEMIQGRIRDLVYADFDVPRDTDLKHLYADYPEAAAALDEAINAWQLSKPNDYANQAFKDFSLGAVLRTVGTYTIPGGLALRYQGNDTLANDAKHYNDLGLTGLATGPQGAKSISTLGSPAATDLEFTQGAEQGAGTATGRALGTAYNDIVYGDDPAHYFTIPQGSTAAQVNTKIAAMTQDERYALADWWISQHTPDEAAQYHEYKNEVDKISAASPEETEFKAFKKTAQDYPGGIPMWRENEVKGNDNYAAYIDKYDDFVKSLQDKGATSIPTLDEYSVNRDAFLAYKGEQKSTYSDAPLDTNTGNAPYLAGAGSGGSTGNSTNQPVDEGAKVTKDLYSYNARLALYNSYIQQLTGNPNASLDGMNPQLQNAIISKLGQLGVSKPNLPSSVDRYQKWSKAEKSQGRDGSLAAYSEFYKRLSESVQGTGLDADTLIDSALGGSTDYFSGASLSVKDPFYDTSLGSYNYPGISPYTGTQLNK